VNLAGVFLILLASRSIHSGSEIHQSRVLAAGGNYFYASRRDVLIRSPLTPGGVSWVSRLP